MPDLVNTDGADVKQPEPGRLSDHLSLGVLARVYRRDLLDRVILETRSREQRARLLPTRLVIYFVIALGLFFGDAYEEVMRRMVGGLRFVNAWERHWQVPTASALSQARARVGEAPLRALFERAAVPLATPSTIGGWLNGWRLMAIDGVTLDVPDTVENAAEFGRPSSRTGLGGAFPQVRIAALSEAGTHAIVGANLGPYRSGERELALGLRPDLEAGMLVCFDRGYYSLEFYRQIVETGADVLFRVSASLILPMLQRFPDDSYLSALTANKTPTPTKLAEAQTLAAAGKATLVRVVEYQIDGRDSTEPYRVITSILEWARAMSGDLAAAYHHRWELEITFDEIETHQTGHSRVLRSKSPPMVRQEIWGILLAHYAIRALIVEAAHDAEEDPDRMSFIRALRVVRREAEGSAAFPPSPPAQS